MEVEPVKEVDEVSVDEAGDSGRAEYEGLSGDEGRA
jgi:hypothetical protein